MSDHLRAISDTSNGEKREIGDGGHKGNLFELMCLVVNVKGSKLSSNHFTSGLSSLSILKLHIAIQQPFMESL